MFRMLLKHVSDIYQSVFNLHDCTFKTISNIQGGVLLEKQLMTKSR